MPRTPTPTEHHTDFLRLEDAAHAIGCGVRWLRDGANHFGFPHDRYGKALWFSRQQRDEIRAMNRKAARPSLMARHRRAKQATRQASQAA